jgi:hypothetical protein
MSKLIETREINGMTLANRFVRSAFKPNRRLAIEHNLLFLKQVWVLTKLEAESYSELHKNVPYSPSAQTTAF